MTFNRTMFSLEEFWCLRFRKDLQSTKKKLRKIWNMIWLSTQLLFRQLWAPTNQIKMEDLQELILMAHQETLSLMFQAKDKSTATQTTWMTCLTWVVMKSHSRLKLKHLQFNLVWTICKILTTSWVEVLMVHRNSKTKTKTRTSSSLGEVNIINEIIYNNYIWRLYIIF